MSSAAAIRTRIESVLADRIPSALTPAPRIIRPVAATGIQNVDSLLAGGLPLGAITEIVGPECSGRTSFALSFIACMTQTAKVCAWIDVSDVLNAESAAAAGLDLSRLLWVRCGVPAGTHVQPALQPAFSLPEKYFIPPPIKQGLHGGGFGSHPRNEAKGLSDAVSGLLRPKTLVPRCAEPQPRVKPEREVYGHNPQRPGVKHNRKPIPTRKILVEDRTGNARNRSSFAGWRLQRDCVGYGQHCARICLARTPGDMVPLPCCCGANTGKHSSADPAFLREEQRGAAPSSSARACTSRRKPPFYRNRASRGSSAPAIHGSFNKCHSIAQATAKGKRCKLAAVKPYGQVVDDEDHRAICLSLCEGVSRASLAAFKTGAARQAMRGDGGGTAVAAGLLASMERHVHSASFME